MLSIFQYDQKYNHTHVPTALTLKTSALLQFMPTITLTSSFNVATLVNIVNIWASQRHDEAVKTLL